MPVPPEIAQRSGVDEKRGAVVAEVVEGSPAARTGLKQGDVIVAFEGRPIRTPRDLTRAVAATPPGTKVTLEIAGREGRRTVTATLGELQEQQTRR